MDKALNLYYLQQLEIDVWLPKTEQTLVPAGCLSSLQNLADKVSNCTQCSLHQGRTQTVFARGNPQAKLMVIGEAPGFYEDQQGKPFVGKAGILLDKMLAAIGINEEQVYIANVIKCRPPNNRDPQLMEIEACQSYLQQQIDLIKPKLLLAVGRFAGQFLAKNNIPLNRLRNQLQYYDQTPFFVTYHPAYLLRNPRDKKQTFQDLLQVQQWLLSNNA